MKRAVLAASLIAATVAAEPVSLQQAEQGVAPKFVRLSDGTIVPGDRPGVICRAETAAPEEGGRARRWLIVVPFAAAGIACAVLCRGAETVRRMPPPDAATPEPLTLLTLGGGLMLSSRRRK